MTTEQIFKERQKTHLTVPNVTPKMVDKYILSKKNKDLIKRSLLNSNTNKTIVNNKKLIGSFNNINKTSTVINTLLKPLIKIYKNIPMMLMLGAGAVFGILTILKNQTQYESIGYNEDGYTPSDRSNGRMSEKGINDLLNYEGFDAVAVDREGDGILTIGYGHKGKDVKHGQTITREQAKLLFKQDLKPREDAVNKLVKVPISQNMFDALVSFTYNAGVGSLAKSEILKKLNSGDYQGAAEAWKTQNIRQGSKFERGLRSRRAKESRIFSIDIGQDNKLIKPEINPLNTQKINLSYKGKYYSSNGTNNATWDGKKITTQYKEVDSLHKKGHTGLDIAYNANEPIYAFIGGIVIQCGHFGGFGIAVCIKDSKGYTHVYGHLNRHCVRKGQPIKIGQLIGYAGSTGRSTGVHLHYGIWKPGTFGDNGGANNVDPRTFNYGDTTNNNVNTTNQNKPRNVGTIKTDHKQKQINTKPKSTQQNKQSQTSNNGAIKQKTTPNKKQIQYYIDSVDTRYTKTRKHTIKK